jgi:predicted regulator of Ras-like GTPase activity (Roadblock/LC7/MglB family)
MSETIQTTLLALKDVSGIQGSFVLSKEGSLLAMQMPALFDASMFAELGPRIERLAESFSSIGDEMDSCLVRFADHMLCIKQFTKGGSLCILTDRSVNLPALKMAVNLADRRLAAEIATAKPAVAAAPPAPAPMDPPASTPAKEAASPPEAEHKAPRFYRGHLVEE